LRSIDERSTFSGVVIRQILDQMAQIIDEPIEQFALKLELSPLPA
jgi:hypothetical protein